jgi:hypothetical protein
VHFVYHIFMLINSKKWQTVTEVVGFKCDRCGKDVTCDDNYEHQEALHINFVGGYGSVFGDGTKVECDLCQNCLQDLIKDFCRITSTVDIR